MSLEEKWEPRAFLTGLLLVVPYIAHVPSLVVGAALATTLFAMVLIEARTPLRASVLGVLLFVLSYGAIGIMPTIIAGNAEAIVLRDVLRYMVILLLLLFGAGRHLSHHYRSFFAGIVSAATVLAVTGVVAVIVEASTGVEGFLGTRSYFSEKILILDLPTSSSYLWNTNYFGTSLLIALTIHTLANPLHLGRLTFRVVTAALTLGVLASGSRSSVGLVILLACFRWAFRANDTGPETHTTRTFTPLVHRAVALVAFSLGIVLIIQAGLLADAMDFFTSKGLNERDRLAQSAWAAFRAQPLGYGFGALGSAMLAHGATTTTPQNTYLAYLLIGGPLMLAFVTVTYGAVLLRLRRRHTTVGPPASVEIVILVIVVVESFFRTYLLGGIGLMPFLMSFIVLRSLGGWR